MPAWVVEDDGKAGPGLFHSYLGLPTTEPLPRDYLRQIDWKSRPNLNLAVCHWCLRGEHDQCEKFFLPFCGCYRDDHEEL